MVKLIKSLIKCFIASLIVVLQDINIFKVNHIIETTLIGGISTGISAVLNVIQKKIGGESNG